MNRLGAIIAGGKSTRFGSEKAEALLNGLPLLEHIAHGLNSQVDRLIVCGRSWPGLQFVADCPRNGMGPLGGLCAALHYAEVEGFDQVLTAGCDVLPVPDLPDLKDEEAAFYIEGHFLFGLWSVSLASHLQKHLQEQTDYSMRHWIKTIGARPISADRQYYNFNSPVDLVHYANLQERDISRQSALMS